MKCWQCSTDAPAETDPKSGRLRCARCHALVGSGTTESTAVRQARDILQKWSTTDLLDQISSFPPVPPLPEPTRSAETVEDSAVADSASGDLEQIGQSQLHPPGVSAVATTGTTESVPDDGTNSETADEPAHIIRMEPANRQSESAASVPEQELKTSGDDPETQNIPRLSMLRTDQSVESANSQEQGSFAESEKADFTGSAESQDRKQSIKQRRRRQIRPTLNRRYASSALPTVQLQSETPQQGSDLVQKHLRVDRPGKAKPDSDIRIPTEETSVHDQRIQGAPVTRRVRIDSAEELSDLTHVGGRIRAEGRNRQRYVDESHGPEELRGPHFDISPPQRSSLTSLTGQFLAYVGVLGLTVGTAIVIYGHFGGYSEYTPTGWLVTTVAQMMLFLGIINLVSGGIEQNNNDVSRRINVLGDQLMRIEQVTESAMRGPKIPVDRYSEEISSEQMSQNETVQVDDR
ncbi:MAG: hypothetical protein MK110_11190 [Fuerstiella sp.]|nr:hypothetical protein [Fuerstiella sp.]